METSDVIVIGGGMVGAAIGYGLARAGAKTLLLDESCTLNILDIGLESGFNSKSTFYYQFKKSTGKTPSEFRATREANS